MKNLAKIAHRFCTASISKPAPDIYSSTPLRDYEYSSIIQSYLTKNEILPAITILMQSHLHSCVLDIQTYNSVLKKIPESMDISFLDVIYKLYRQHFGPSLIMQDTMISLINNIPEIYNTLKQDFQALKLPVPAPLGFAFQGRRKRSFDKTKLKKVNEEVENSLLEKILIPQKISSVQEQLLKSLNPFASHDIRVEDVQITLHDLEYNENESEYEDSDVERVSEEEQYSDQENRETQGLPFDLSLIKTIKIGRIEILKKKDP